MTGCQGELAEKEIHVVIEDGNGQVVLDEMMTTQSNGFFDLWLPRNQTYNMKIQYEEKMVESEISTFENDGTCITTMKLT